MQKQLDGMESDLKEVKEALLGTEFNNNKGLIHAVEEHSKYIKTDKKMKYTIAGVGIGIGLIKTGWSTIAKLFSTLMM